MILQHFKHLRGKQMETNIKPKVLAFSGSGRSGSTILEILLGQQSGFVAVGEMTRLWYHGYHKNILSGSRVPVRESELWVGVADEVFGGVDKVDGAAIHHLRVRSFLEAFRIITKTASEDTMKRVREYADILSKTYQAIAKVSNKQVIVDASKDTRHVCVLAHTQGIDLRLLHLIRDSRAVVYSWSKPKKRLDADEYIHQPNLLVSSMKWNVHNFYSELIKRQFPSLQILYEEYVHNIEDTLWQILNFMEIENDSVTTEIDMDRITEQHGIWGNPVRFEKNINIGIDARWKREMPQSHKYLSTFLTLPMLLYYKYNIIAMA
jgi:hypothetical protein